MSRPRKCLRQRLEARGLTRRARLLSYLAITLVMFLATSTGCGTTSAERLAATEQALAHYEDKTTEVDAAIKGLEDLIAEAHASLADATGDTAEEIRRVIVDAQGRLDQLKAEKPKLDEAVSNWRARLAEVQANPNLTWADEATAAGAGLQASAPLFGQYGWIVSGLGLLVGAIGTVFGARQNAKAKNRLSSLQPTSP